LGHCTPPSAGELDLRPGPLAFIVSGIGGTGKYWICGVFRCNTFRINRHFTQPRVARLL